VQRLHRELSGKSKSVNNHEVHHRVLEVVQTNESQIKMRKNTRKKPQHVRQKSTISHAKLSGKNSNFFVSINSQKFQYVGCNAQLQAAMQ